MRERERERESERDKEKERRERDNGALTGWKPDSKLMDIMWPISQSHFHVSC